MTIDIEQEKLLYAREILNQMATGINPVNGEAIDADSFLQDPRIIRCLFYVNEVLTRAMNGPFQSAKRPPGDFRISPEEKRRIRLPSGKIGVNEFARAVNEVIDIRQSRKLTGVELNRRLKHMGILGEEALPGGKTRTTVNAKSAEFGIETEKRRSYQGHEYEKLLFTDKGKQFLLDNLETIMFAAEP